MTKLLGSLRGARPSSRGLALFTVTAALPLLALVLWRPLAAAVATSSILVAIGWRRSPIAVGVLIIGASIAMRLGFIGISYADQIAVSHSAFERVLAGSSPYGVGYDSTWLPGGSFPYGPLGLLWWLPGPPIEFAAAIAVLIILAWQRAWLTLAVAAGWAPAVTLTAAGINDYSPGLLILVGVLALRNRPLLGAALLAVAAALKPYALAWFLPAIGYGGWAVAGVLVGTSAVLWAPLFLWWGGLSTFLESVRISDQATTDGNGLAAIRWLAVPIAAGGLLMRRWDVAVLTGSLAFAVFLGPTRWFMENYWVALIPTAGVGLESLLGDRSRAKSMLWPREEVVGAVPDPVNALETSALQDLHG
jgi:hypothetical protein